MNLFERAKKLTFKYLIHIVSMLEAREIQIQSTFL